MLSTKTTLSVEEKRLIGSILNREAYNEVFMNPKIIILTLLLLPLFFKANTNEICLGDTYEKVKGIKGFPKEVAFTKVGTKVDGSSETKRFEAVTFYKDDVI